MYNSYVYNTTHSHQKFPVQHLILPPIPKRPHFALLSVSILLLCPTRTPITMTITTIMRTTKFFWFFTSSFELFGIIYFFFVGGVSLIYRTYHISKKRCLPCTAECININLPEVTFCFIYIFAVNFWLKITALLPDLSQSSQSPLFLESYANMHVKQICFTNRR